MGLGRYVQIETQFKARAVAFTETAAPINRTFLWTQTQAIQHRLSTVSASSFIQTDVAAWLLEVCTCSYTIFPKEFAYVLCWFSQQQDSLDVSQASGLVGFVDRSAGPAVSLHSIGARPK